jgi:hypothetical protein
LWRSGRRRFEYSGVRRREIRKKWHFWHRRQYDRKCSRTAYGKRHRRHRRHHSGDSRTEAGAPHARRALFTHYREYARSHLTCVPGRHAQQNDHQQQAGDRQNHEQCGQCGHTHSPLDRRRPRFADLWARGMLFSCTTVPRNPATAQRQRIQCQYRLDSENCQKTTSLCQRVASPWQSRLTIPHVPGPQQMTAVQKCDTVRAKRAA